MPLGIGMLVPNRMYLWLPGKIVLKLKDEINPLQTYHFLICFLFCVLGLLSPVTQTKIAEIISNWDENNRPFTSGLHKEVACKPIFRPKNVMRFHVGLVGNPTETIVVYFCAFYNETNALLHYIQQDIRRKPTSSIVKIVYWQLNECSPYSPEYI